MSYTIAPALRAIRADANNVAPGRSTASDGDIGDAVHAAQGAASDHNPDPVTGIVHAVDITNDPAHGMDTWHWAQIIAGRIASGAETRVEYLVSNDGAKDVIFHLAVHGTSWVQNGSSPVQEHRNHLHTSIKHTAAAENDVRPYFVAGSSPAPTPGDDDLTPEQAAQLKDVHAFISEIKAPVHNPGDPVHVGILQKISDVHAWVSETKTRLVALFTKSGV